FFFSSRRRHTRSLRDWSSDVCSSDLVPEDACARVLWHFLHVSLVDCDLAMKVIVQRIFLAERSERVVYRNGRVVVLAGVRERLRSEERRVGDGWRCLLWRWDGRRVAA